MILQEIRNIKSDKKELRKFGLTLGVVSLIWIGLFFWHKRSLYFPIFILPGVLFTSAYIYPFILKWPHKTLRSLFIIINWTITRIVLCILFYGVITPISIFSRLFGKRFLDLKLNKSIDSYWIVRKEQSWDRESYQKQF